MADNYLEELMREYREGKERDYVSAPDYASDPYRGLADDMPLPEAPAMTREDELASELEDVKLQQKEHNLLKEKSKLAKAKVDNNNNEFNEYSVGTELETPDVNSYEEDKLMEPFQVPGSMTEEKMSVEPKVGTNDFRETLGQRESSGNYEATQGQYLGKYQMGKMALQDLGYKDEKGEWTGKGGVTSDEDFLKKPDVQEAAMGDWESLLEKRLKSNGALDFDGEYVQGTEITKDGLKAAAHLVGPTAVSRMLKSGEVPQDALGTKATDYLNLMNKKPIDVGIPGQGGNVEPGFTNRQPASNEQITDEVPPKVIEAKAGDELKTREDGVKTPQEILMEEYKKTKDDARNQELISGISDFAGNVGRGFVQMKARQAAANATRAGAKGVTGELGFKPIDTSSKVQVASSKKLKKLQSMIDKLKKGPETQIVQADGVVKLIDKQTGDEIKTIGEAKKAGTKAGGDKDPSSEASKVAREKYRAMFPGLDISDKLSESDLNTNTKDMISNARIQEYYKPKTEISKQRLNATEKERARKWFNDNQEDLKKSIDNFNKDDVVKKAKTTIGQMGMVREILNSDNPIGDNTISTFMSRGSGEVGALSEGDKVPFGGAKGIKSKLKAIIREYNDGKLTDENRGYLLKLADTFDKAALRNMENMADKRAKQFGGIDFSPEILKAKFMGTDAGYIDPDGIIPNYEFNEGNNKKSTKTVMRKGYNPKTNQTQLIYSDGSKEIVEGRK